MMISVQSTQPGVASPSESASIAAVSAPLRVLALLPEPETVESCLRCAVAAVEGRHARINAIHIGFDPRYVLASAEEVGI
ncbi:MAG: hypothetical protein P4L82_14035, partial [Ancalomicrobiaceae bacterium]|nr:hypothetical protein [Ancalomicrobiaceae bacterium]